MVTIGPPEKPMLRHSLEDARHVNFMERESVILRLNYKKLVHTLAFPTCILIWLGLLILDPRDIMGFSCNIMLHKMGRDSAI